MELPATSKSTSSSGNFPKYTPRDFARLTVAEAVYHQPGRGESTSIGKPYNRILQTDEQPYIRILTLTDEWHYIAVGCWLEKASQLIILAEKGDNAVEVGLAGATFSSIPPGESTRLTDPAVDRICVRGKGKVTIVLIPS